MNPAADAKPVDCTCQYPRIKCRNGSGHDPSCPVHVRFQAFLDASRAPAPAKPEFERKARQALFMLIDAIAAQHGPEVAARVVDGLYWRYHKRDAQQPAEVGVE